MTKWSERLENLKRLGSLNMTEELTWIRRRLDAIVDRLERPQYEPPPPPRFIVIWGASRLIGEGFTELPSKKLGMRTVRPNTRTIETVFSIAVPGSPTSVRVYHDVYRPFKMTRWLLIGEGKVTNILVGQNLQTAVGAGPVLSGIAGRMGEGNFDTADVGVRISFEVIT